MLQIKHKLKDNLKIITKSFSIMNNDLLRYQAKYFFKAVSVLKSDKAENALISRIHRVGYLGFNDGSKKYALKWNKIKLAKITWRVSEDWRNMLIPMFAAKCSLTKPTPGMICKWT